MFRVRYLARLATLLATIVVTLGYAIAANDLMASQARELSPLEKKRDCLNRGLPASCHNNQPSGLQNSFGKNKVSITSIPCRTCDSDDNHQKITKTAIFQPSSNSPNYILITLKGGDGQHNGFGGGILPRPAGTLDKTLIQLVKHGAAVFIPDWEYDMCCVDWGGYDPKLRGSKNHLERLLGVAEYAKKEIGELPVYFLGHSNGTSSLEQLSKYIQNNPSAQVLVSGMVLSAPLKQLTPDFKGIHVAYMGHRKDKCPNTRWSLVEKQYNQFAAGKASFNRKPVTAKSHTLVGISLGVDGPDHPSFGGKRGCGGGYHSYLKSDEEIITKLSDLFNTWSSQ
jgi:hypothetical protein